ncbi:MAG TPA: helix-turn-helix domain-containing protein [Pyrinomonadaceae bacterium]|nr:helix-turn-helix domain-containing protein [Pyrinomonadaceae bacterium]
MSETATANSSLLTKTEAAAILRVAPITVHRLIKNRLLGSHRIGARVFTTQQFIDEYLQRNSRRPKAA